MTSTNGQLSSMLQGIVIEPINRLGIILGKHHGSLSFGDEKRENDKLRMAFKYGCLIYVVNQKQEFTWCARRPDCEKKAPKRSGGSA
ncbi:unnamed protein product [Blumeria hordei]|uniref:Uncharacterized protein n=1 Tax=Blumeria hordei TaxID=2867405 RepID=A0A383UQ28_BLUHO|nr:unnamed protein product [Blumeria hordei]